MCGIGGILDPGLAPGDWRTLLQRMQAPMENRGPDARGRWFDEEAGIGLAHRRLSIIDLSEAGHQPMVSASGRFVISYNGEVYNFEVLRSRLTGLGHSFRGHSDTEVVLAAIEEWGIRGAVERFVGMFAFGVWDRQRRKLTLVRDRLGIKPLYVGNVGGRLAFASSLSPLETVAEKPLDIDRTALSLLLRDSYIAAPLSIYEQVKKLPPGHLLQVEPADAKSTSLPTPEPYWSAFMAAREGGNGDFGSSPEAAVDHLEERLSTAVRDRLVADVPVGAFLSGGIDSSTVVATMQSLSSAPIRTFSIGFQEDDFDEASHARRVARLLDTEHRELVVTPEEARAVIPRLPELYDEPFADSSQIPTFLVSKLARQDVKVALSGDGGDELFAGYDRYGNAMNTRQKLGRIPGPARRTLGALLQFVGRASDGSGFLDGVPVGSSRGTVGDEIRRLGELLSASSPLEAYRAANAHWNRAHALVIGAERYRTGSWSGIGETDVDFPNSMMLLDIVTYLPDDILVKVDRASMGVSLEARVPLLDHRVVETALKLPLSLKRRDGSDKWILRRVLYRKLPKELFDRPKHGFSVPIARWLRGPLTSWADELLDPERIAARGLIRPQPVARAWRQHKRGEVNWAHRLWPVLMFETWMEHSKPSAPRTPVQEPRG